MFVVEIRPDTREVVVGPRADMLGRGVVLNDLNWLGRPPEVGEDLQVQLRHRAAATNAQLVKISDEKLELILPEAQFAITPGQSGVLFSGNRVLGGGRIVQKRSAST